MDTKAWIWLKVKVLAAIAGKENGIKSGIRLNPGREGGFGCAPKYQRFSKYVRQRQTGEWLQKYHWKEI